MELIRPDELPDGPAIPDFVFKAFNRLIKEAWDGQAAIFSLSLALQAVKQERKEAIAAGLVSERDKHANPEGARWMDVEPYYREAGWHAEYSHDDEAYIFKKHKDYLA